MILRSKSTHLLKPENQVVVSQSSIESHFERQSEKEIPTSNDNNRIPRVIDASDSFCTIPRVSSVKDIMNQWNHGDEAKG